MSHEGFIKTFSNLWKGTEDVSIKDIASNRRFIRIRVRFDVTVPLIHRTPVTFSKVGEKLVEFKYEYLPEYFFACGRISHPTQVCIKKYESPWDSNPSLLAQFSFTFADLEEDTNLWGKSIGTMARHSSGFYAPSWGNAIFMPQKPGQVTAVDDRTRPKFHFGIWAQYLRAQYLPAVHDRTPPSTCQRYMNFIFQSGIWVGSCQYVPQES
ncbi:hypothetical protein L3X38_032023 [Prunus dulcis]|uniref:Zinc knuckle CX2CX4HX4C domain-containing protein n=1 Tax=Prunus dulcis TaxID=3755 RepID=A0AAD4VFF5_PRUDU|nr:hypothetical protein L3X38_032023 [Prunus dulcis]